MKIAVETGEVDSYSTMFVVMDCFKKIVKYNYNFPLNDKELIAKTINKLFVGVGFGLMRFDMIEMYENNDIDLAERKLENFLDYLEITSESIKFDDEIVESGNCETFVLDTETDEIKAI